MRSALLAADLVLIPVQPSPLDGWASAEMLALLSEARIYRPELRARFVLNRCGARTVIARETAETLADHDPPVIGGGTRGSLQVKKGDRVLFTSYAPETITIDDEEFLLMSESDILAVIE